MTVRWLNSAGGGVVSCVYRDIGSSPRMELRRSPTCVVTDHHWDTTVVKGGGLDWM